MICDGKVTEGFTDRLQQVAGNGTGYLQVQDVPRERRGWVFLEDQDVVAVLVDGYQPRLGRRLTTSGFVSIADMAQVLTVVKDEYDPRIAVECVTRGLVDAATIEALYREFMLSAASSVNEWDLGESHWVADASPWEGRSVPVSVPALVSAMARRKQHWTELWTELSAETIPDRIPVRTGRNGLYIPETPDESAVLAAVDGRRTVDQVAGECGYTRFQAGHLLSGLMAKRVLDLLPVDGPRPVPDSLPVEAGYFAPSQPFPDTDDTGASAANPGPAVDNSGQPSAPVAPGHSWVVPLAVPDPLPTQPLMDPPPQNPAPAVPLPVTDNNPEGNVVTQYVEAGSAHSVGENDHPGEVDTVPAPETLTDALPEVLTDALPEVLTDALPEVLTDALPEVLTDALPETLTDDSGATPAEDADTNGPTGDVGNPEPTPEPELEGTPDLVVQDQDVQLPPVSRPSLGEFFVDAAPGLLGVPFPEQPDGPAPESAAQHPALPPLPTITGGPSDFYVALPSSHPALTGGVPVAALSGLPASTASQALTAAVSEEPPAAELTAEPAPKTIPTKLDHPHCEAVIGEPETAARSASEVESDAEVAQLREDLLGMASERTAAMDKAILLRGLAVTHTAEAADAAARAEEDGRIIARLKTVTSDASAIAVNRLEGLRLAQAEAARIGEIKAQIDAEAETARKTVVVGQRKLDEASAAQANLQRDLQAVIARQEAASHEWTAAKDGAARSEANARHADATVTECDQLMSEARERLTALAAAHRPRR